MLALWHLIKWHSSIIVVVRWYPTIPLEMFTEIVYGPPTDSPVCGFTWKTCTRERWDLDRPYDVVVKDYHMWHVRGRAYVMLVRFSPSLLIRISVTLSDMSDNLFTATTTRKQGFFLSAVIYSSVQSPRKIPCIDEYTWGPDKFIEFIPGALFLPCAHNSCRPLQIFSPYATAAARWAAITRPHRTARPWAAQSADPCRPSSMCLPRLASTCRPARREPPAALASPMVLFLFLSEIWLCYIEFDCDGWMCW
jgi:hypothetical protein